jgi:hypothetical protein
MQIRLIINLTEFAIGLEGALATELNRGLNKAAPLIQSDVKLLINELMQDSDTYKSLLSGELRGEFGLRHPSNILPDIISIMQQSVNVRVNTVKFVGHVIYGGLIIEFVRGNFSDILSSPNVSYPSKTFIVKWLEWLLTAGDTIIIADYHIKYNLQPQERIKSRTGIAIMEEGGTWRVPPTWAGTITDNWITRTFGSANIQDKITSIIQKNLTG